eukprot:921908-Pleurochrysis_carterae.AAC.1
MSSFLIQHGLTADCVDNCTKDGGGHAHDILINSVYERLLQRCADGYYMAVFASPPCSSFSVSRFFKGENSVDGGPPPVRDLPPTHARELAESNEIIRRTAALLRTARDAGAEFILEHPADRGASNSPVYLHGRHAPLWLMPDITAVKADSGAVLVTFPQYALGATAQKYTSLLCSRR